MIRKLFVIHKIQVGLAGRDFSRDYVCSPTLTSFLMIYLAVSNIGIGLHLRHRLVHEVVQLIVADPPPTPPPPPPLSE